MLIRPSFLRGFFLYWLPVLVVVAAVSIVSSLSSEVLDEATESVRWPITNGTWFHIGEFAVLSLLSYRLAHFYLRWPYQYLTLLVLLLAVGYGLLDELHQSYVPGRDPSLYDVLADVLGAALALSALAVGLVLRQKLSRVVVPGNTD
ncbi:MAG: VanZ family protein [Chloroflexi bacterium]|nr:VanZ family protein [Chloroflexota bacterium]